MEERVADLGGSIVITSRPGEGTSLIATLPIREMNDGG
jgi:signal transduction histidine kinase